jgi:hypothetical protein
MKYSNHGSTRNPSLKHGTRVMVTLYLDIPERMKEGVVKPAETRTYVKGATVLCDSGYSIILKVDGLRTMTVLPEQVSHWDKWHLGIEASRV